MLAWIWFRMGPKYVAILGCWWLYMLLCCDGINHLISFWELKHKTGCLLLKKYKLISTRWPIRVTFCLDLQLMPLDRYECCENWCSETVLCFWCKQNHIRSFYIFRPNWINFGTGHFHRICSVILFGVKTAQWQQYFTASRKWIM
jgi:hypothetical protein